MENIILKLVIGCEIALLFLLILIKRLTKNKSEKSEEYFGGIHYTKLPQWEEISNNGDTCKITDIQTKNGITILEINKSSRDEDGIPYQETIFARV